MITSVTYKPSRICGAYNPIIWTVLSNNINQPDFQYVIDVYINGNYITRITQRPNPSGYGMWDVSAIVQTYTRVSSFTQGELETPNTQWFHDNESASCHVYCKVGERWGINGVAGSFALRNGLAGDNFGPPAYAVYSAYATTNLEVTVLAASLEDHENLWTMQQPSTNGVWKLDPFNNNIAREWSGGLAYPLSNDYSLERNVYNFDKGTLSWINYSPGTGNGLIFGFRYRVYNAAGTLVLTTDIPLTTGNGMGPKALCSTVYSIQPAAQYDLVHVNYSPSILASRTGLAITDGWSVIIQGHNYSNYSACTFGSAVTQPITINVENYCEQLYPRVRVSWLNEWGGRDYYNFTMYAVKTINTKSETYTQNQMDWSGNVPVPQLSSGYPPFGTLPTQGGDKIFNKTATNTWRVQTDWLTQDEVNLIEGLQKSPMVIAYIYNGSSIANSFPYSCKVKGEAYEVKLVKQDKLTQATFELDLNMTQSLQNT